MTDTTGSGSPPSPSSSSPPTRRSRSRFQQSSSSFRRRKRSWSPRSPSSSPSGGRRSRSRSWSPMASSFRGEEEANALYLFLRYPSPPIGYCLYAISMLKPDLPLPLLRPCNQSRGLEKTIYPILEFPYEEYPSNMCCVQFESNLYFLGGLFLSGLGAERRRKGKDWDPMALCPRDVYILNTKIISTNTTPTSHHPSALLKKGVPMRTGKPSPYGFAAERKIYAIATFTPFMLSRFEVFDLRSQKWSVLPDPPMHVKFTGHAIVGGVVFIVTENEDVFSFNLNTKAWNAFSKYCVPRPPFYGRAEFTDDALFGVYRHAPTAFGPASESKSHPEDKAKEFFKRRTLLSTSSDLGDAIKPLLRENEPSSCLVYLGNKTFCYVLTSSLRNPKLPFNYLSSDPEKRNIHILTFELIRETDTESCSRGEKTFFQSKLLCTTQFVARTKCGAISGEGVLKCAFSGFQ